MKVDDDISKVICLDFDGVINDYQGWRDEGFDVILDEPFADARESIQTLRDLGYTILVHSTRCAHPGGHFAIWKWLKEHDIEVDRICDEKPLASLYIDDRGYHHTSWADTIGMFARGAAQNSQKGA